MSASHEALNPIKTLWEKYLNEGNAEFKTEYEDGRLTLTAGTEFLSIIQEKARNIPGVLVEQNEFEPGEAAPPLTISISDIAAFEKFQSANNTTAPISPSVTPVSMFSSPGADLKDSKTVSAGNQPTEVKTIDLANQLLKFIDNYQYPIDATQLMQDNKLTITHNESKQTQFTLSYRTHRLCTGEHSAVHDKLKNAFDELKLIKLEMPEPKITRIDGDGRKIREIEHRLIITIPNPGELLKKLNQCEEAHTKLVEQRSKGIRRLY